MAVMLFEKCDPQKIVDVLSQRQTQMYSRLRSHIVKVADRYYFKEFTATELAEKLKTAVTIKHGVESMNQVSWMVSHEQPKTISADDLQWQVWVLPDVEGQTLMVWKGHHLLGDGLGFSIMLATLQEEYSPSQFVQTASQQPWWKVLLMKLI